METSGIRRLASEKTLFFLTAAIMFLMPVSELFTELLFNYFPKIIPSVLQPLILGVYGILGTIIVIICKGCELTDNQATDKWYLSDLIYLILCFFMAVSAVFSTNPGVYSRNVYYTGETPLHFLAYFFLFFSGSRIKSADCRRKLISFFLVIAVLQGAVAFLQTFDIEIAYCLLTRHSGAAYGLTQNSNYFAALALLLLACVTGAYLFSEKISDNRVLRYVLPVLAGFVFYIVMGTRGRLIWFGFVPMMLFFAVSGIVMLKGEISRASLKRYFIRFAVLSAVFIAVFAVTHLFTDYVAEAVKRSQMEIEGKLDNGIGSNRLMIWEYGIRSIPRHWITGIGLDNYCQVFFEDPGFTEGSFWIDKAHNEYLHVLVTQGVFAFLAYAVLFVRTAVISVKKIFKGKDETDQALTWIFLGMFITYAAQAFFNTSVINVAMYFWLVLGLLNTSAPLKPSLNKNI